MTRPLHWAVVLVVVVAVATGSVLLVRLSNGDFSGDYRLTGYFPRAGEGLQPGSEVVFRGVQVGRVATIALAGTRAKVTVLIDPDFRVPADATATIAPVNLFGAEQVTLTTPAAGNGSGTATASAVSTGGATGAGAGTRTGAGAAGPDADAGPYLPAGGSFAHARTSDELGDLFAAAAPLLSRINTQNLSAVVSDLAQASDGEGPRIARAIDAGASLAGYLDKTLAAQLAALDAFSRFTAAVAPDGTAVNGLSKQENVALPVFNQDVADYKRLLDNLTPFAGQLAQLLADYQPDIDTLLSQGDNVARVLVAQQANLGQVVQGAYEYAYKVGEAGSSATLPDGSRYVYFNTFVLFTDVNTLVCDLLAPDEPNLAFLEPVQQALAGAGTPFDCQSQLAAFDAAQGTASSATSTTTTPAATPASGSSSPASSGSSSPATSAGQSLATQIYGILGKPSSSASSSIGGYVQSLLGGGL